MLKKGRIHTIQLIIMLTENEHTFVCLKVKIQQSRRFKTRFRAALISLSIDYLIISATDSPASQGVCSLL